MTQEREPRIEPKAIASAAATIQRAWRSRDGSPLGGGSVGASDESDTGASIDLRMDAIVARIEALEKAHDEYVFRFQAALDDPDVVVPAERVEALEERHNVLLGWTVGVSALVFVPATVLLPFLAYASLVMLR